MDTSRETEKGGQNPSREEKLDQKKSDFKESGYSQTDASTPGTPDFIGTDLPEKPKPLPVGDGEKSGGEESRSSK